VEKRPSLGDVVGAAAFTIGLITAWLYATGWSYAYAYFAGLRIPFLLADIPREHLLLYGGLAVQKLPWVSLGLGVALTGTAGFVIRQSPLLGRGPSLGVTSVCVLIFFLFGTWIGERAAGNDLDLQRQTDYAAFPRTNVRLASDTNLAEIADLLETGCARLVLSNTDLSFFVVPRRNAPALEINTIAVPWHLIETLTIADRYTSCP